MSGKLCNPAALFQGNFFTHWRSSPPVGQGLLIIEASRSHSDTPHSLGLLWMSDQPDAATAAWQHTTLKRGTHPFFRRDSNPVPASERLQTHALDRAATGLGSRENNTRCPLNGKLGSPQSVWTFQRRGNSSRLPWTELRYPSFKSISYTYRTTPDPQMCAGNNAEGW
jgi:hypothetical protein